MKSITLSNTGVFVKKHPQATLVIDSEGVYRLYASVNKRKPTIYHEKAQALRNYRRAIQLHGIDKHCNCNDCQSDALAYSQRVVTASARQTNGIAYLRQASQF